MTDDLNVTTLAPADWLQAAHRLREGQVGVVRTDTLYGLVAIASSKAAVERVYRLRDRPADKACIVLVADEGQLFDPIPARARQQLQQLWPGPVSVALPARHSPEWLPLFNQTLAYRMPALQWLRELLEVTGPLIAPSANPAGKQPARSLAEATEYFGTAVDFYLDGGQVPNDQPASSLYNLEADSSLRQLR